MEKVRQLRLQKLGEEVAHKKLLDFVSLVKSTMQLPPEGKPKRSSWDSMLEFKMQIESLRAIALVETGISSEGKESGMQVFMECLFFICICDLYESLLTYFSVVGM